MMELTVLAVPDCPNAPALEERLAEALADRPAVPVARQVITDAAQAARWGMHGSPTLLVNGADPFAAPGTPPALACRMYQGENGRLEGAPSVTALRQVLEQACARG
jgi:predicted DsbA family dithiol-disulfide isomerase